MNFPHEKWERVTKHDPCPICSKDHWCTIAPDRSAVRCKSVQSQHPAHGKDGEAWIHKTGEGGRVFFPKPRPAKNGQAPPPHQELDWQEQHQLCRLKLTQARTEELMKLLGVSEEAIELLGVGYCETRSAWTFPVRDGKGRITGIKTRKADGSQGAFTGTKYGLVYGQITGQGWLVAVEGQSDALAVLTLGYADVVGIPGASNGLDTLVELAVDRDVVIVSDNDEKGEAGGEEAAIRCSKVARSVRRIKPPTGTKDIRDWVNGGARRDDVDRSIAEAKPKSKGAVDDNWREIPSGLLSTPPAARKWLLRHPDRNHIPVTDRHGDGFLPLGKAGLLMSAGGVGKTKVLIALAVSVITGRKWFNHFDVDEEVDGDVLLALAEEDFEEIHRRLYDVAEALKLTEAERRKVEQHLVVLPLAGIQCTMAAKGLSGEIQATRMVDDILRRMQGRKWSLVALDPLARMAGVPIDVDNLNATFVVTECERIAVTGPTVVVAHHTSKGSRRLGKAESRGASAIEDGCRWVAALVEDDDHVLFRQTKSNYSRPMPEKDSIRLMRDAGILRSETAAEKEVLDKQAQTAEQAELDRHVDLVIANLRRLGSASSVDEACSGCGIHITQARVAFRRANTSKKVINLGSARSPDYRAV